MCAKAAIFCTEQVHTTYAEKNVKKTKQFKGLIWTPFNTIAIGQGEDITDLAVLWSLKQEEIPTTLISTASR